MAAKKIPKILSSLIALITLNIIMLNTLAKNHTDWLATYDWDVALTLDYKANTTQRQVEKANRCYWQRIDCKLFGATQVKKGKRLQRAVFVETGRSGMNWHVHAAIKLADCTDLCIAEQQVGYTAETLGKMLIQEWVRFDEAGRFSVAKAVYDAAGWVRYISKDAGRGAIGFDALTTNLN